SPGGSTKVDHPRSDLSSSSASARGLLTSGGEILTGRSGGFGRSRWSTSPLSDRRYWRAMSGENVELTYQAYDAFNRRDSAAFLELMDADVEALSRLAAMEGGYHGHDGIRRWWQNLLDAIPDFTFEAV